MRDPLRAARLSLRREIIYSLCAVLPGAGCGQSAGGPAAARGKFLQASDGMREAMNGQEAFDNEQAARLSRQSEVFKWWSESAELERKTRQEAFAVADTGTLRRKLTGARTAQKKMNDVLTSMIRGVG